VEETTQVHTTQVKTTQLLPVNFNTVRFVNLSPYHNYAERHYICGDWGAFDYDDKVGDRQKTKRELQLLPFFALCEGGGGGANLAPHGGEGQGLGGLPL